MSPKIYLNSPVFVIEMNNSTNKIEGIGLIKNKPSSPMELYNLKTDPFEKINVIMENANIYADLNKRLMQHIQHAGKIPWQKP
jgi:hypothetical protein